MTYGLQKMRAHDAVESIVTLIREHLLKMDAFQNPSLAYYGIEISYKVDLLLHSRGENERVVEGSQLLGKKTDENPKKVRARDKASAGRKLTMKPGDHVRPREGFPV